MKTKEFLNGNLVIGKWLYNVLYTFLCVCVLLITLVLMFYGLTGLVRECVIESIKLKHLLLVYLIMMFLIYKLFSKKHYV